MMDLAHLLNLHGRARVRKTVLILERIERESVESIHAFPLLYLRELAVILKESPESPGSLVQAACSFLQAIAREQLSSEESGDTDTRSMLRALNQFRHVLMRISGQTPADWDFVNAPRSSSGLVQRKAGMRVYLEDVRSPFNIGSIFRTAEALGFEEIILSPECADPMHARARRSAMGTIERMAWRRAPVSSLAEMGGTFALEVGGSALGKFTFPLPGVMVLGSEELGISSDALQYCTAGRVEIPLVGAKASLNVATAFGIAAFAWFSGS